MTTRMTEILNALKANHKWRALEPDGRKWRVYDYSTKQVVLDGINENTVFKLFYAEPDLRKGSNHSLHYVPLYTHMVNGYLKDLYGSQKAGLSE
jgi:hypothetical protein